MSAIKRHLKALGVPEKQSRMNSSGRLLLWNR